MEEMETIEELKQNEAWWNLSEEEKSHYAHSIDHTANSATKDTFATEPSTPSNRSSRSNSLPDGGANVLDYLEKAQTLRNQADELERMASPRGSPVQGKRSRPRRSKSPRQGTVPKYLMGDGMSLSGKESTGTRSDHDENDDIEDAPCSPRTLQAKQKDAVYEMMDQMVIAANGGVGQSPGTLASDIISVQPSKLQQKKNQLKERAAALPYCEEEMMSMAEEPLPPPAPKSTPKSAKSTPKKSIMKASPRAGAPIRFLSAAARAQNPLATPPVQMDQEIVVNHDFADDVTCLTMEDFKQKTGKASSRVKRSGRSKTASKSASPAPRPAAIPESPPTSTTSKKEPKRGQLGPSHSSPELRKTTIVFSRDESDAITCLTMEDFKKQRSNRVKRSGRKNTKNAIMETHSEHSSHGSSAHTRDGLSDAGLAQILRKDIHSKKEPVLIAGLDAIKEYAGKGSKQRGKLCAFGAIPSILHIMDNKKTTQAVLLSALGALEKVTAKDPNNQEAACELGAISTVCQVIQKDFSEKEVVLSAVKTLERITTCMRLKAPIGANDDDDEEEEEEEDRHEDTPTQGAMTVLSCCLMTHPKEKELVAYAIGAVANICVHRQHQVKMLSESGGIVAMKSALSKKWKSKTRKKQAEADMDIILKTLGAANNEDDLLHDEDASSDEDDDDDESAEST